MRTQVRNIQNKLTAAMLVMGLAAAGSVNTANAAEIDFGNVGDPIDLVIGYQPYYTEAWSGVVMKGLPANIAFTITPPAKPIWNSTVEPAGKYFS